MSHGFRTSLERSSYRRARRPRQSISDLSVHYRRLGVETLERRLLLSGAPQFSKMVVFGDSLSDTGNDAGWAFLAGYHTNNGRFSSDPDGKPPTSFTKDPGVWHEWLADDLGISRAAPSHNSANQGTNWAYGGAVTGPDTSDGGAIVNVGDQVVDYLTRETTYPVNALYTIWAGANDIMARADKDMRDGNTSVSVTAYEDTAEKAATNVDFSISQLIEQAGARQIVWPNLPELSDTPHALGYPANKSLDWTTGWPHSVDPGWSASVRAAVADAVQTFNADWASEIGGLRATYPSVTIYALDVHSLFEQMLNQRYPGLSKQFNIADEALVSTLANDSADNYLFRDGLHPTERVHKLLGDAAYALIERANDNFDSATVITGTSATATGSNYSATTEPREPNNCEGVGAGQSVWWQWTAPSSGPVQIDTFGSDFETTLSVYTGNSVSTLKVVAGSYDFSDPATGAQTKQSEVTFNAVHGTTYDISVGGMLYTSAVDGTDYYTSGDITLNVNLNPPAPSSHPQITSVTPATLQGLPLPQTQLLTINGRAIAP